MAEKKSSDVGNGRLWQRKKVLMWEMEDCSRERFSDVGSGKL